MKKYILLIFVSFIFFPIIACNDGSEPYNPLGEKEKPGGPVKVNSKERTKEIFDLINAKYSIGQTGFYRESHPSQPGDPEYAYLWTVVAINNAAATLKLLGYDIAYEKMIDRFQSYLSATHAGNNISAYNSSTNGATGQGTRFYDDNSIVGLSLLEAYSITNKESYKELARNIIPFLKSGTDPVLGGALWWNEDEKNRIDNPNSNKPTCSNGYATLFLLRYYHICDNSEKQEVLNLAKDLYNWIRNNLFDSTTKCYWNDKNVKGEINNTLWTYNTGVMIQNGIELYKITNDRKYLDQAIESAIGSYDYFAKMRNGIISFPDHDPWFNTKLLRAYIDILPYHSTAKTYIDVYSKSINYAYDNARTSDELFYEDWTGKQPNRYYLLLMQASVVESYGAIALYEEQSEDN
jgi:hypothetical protein